MNNNQNQTTNSNFPTDPKERKERPIARGVLDYFPDALAEVARVSFVGNEQHNPGQEMHWARGKSNDHADCIVRHLIERGTIDTDGLPHSGKVAWRALAMLQIELEIAREHGQAGKDYITLMRDHRKNALSACLAGDQSSTAVTATEAALARAANVRRMYIAGPMRGHENLNFPAFDRARDLALSEGWDPISPADLDRENNVHEDHVPTFNPADTRVFARRDCDALLSLRAELGDAIAMLPGWTRSTGARAEFFLASWLGLRILDATSMTPLEYTKHANHGGLDLSELCAAAARTIEGGI